MENPIICPHCKKSLVDQQLVEDAIKGQGPTTRSMMCECGERITYWQITAQLRDQKTLGWRFRNWIKSLSQNQGQ